MAVAAQVPCDAGREGEQRDQCAEEGHQRIGPRLVHSRCGTERAAYDLVAQGFGPGRNGPLVVAADLAGDPGAVARLVDALGADRGIASVAPANVNTAASIASVAISCGFSLLVATRAL